MNSYFQKHKAELIDAPEGTFNWWHSMPLPNGKRISGASEDKDLQFKMWQALRIPNEGGLSGKRVLDIGANDGFFSIAALMAGAESVTSVDKDWKSWPGNIRYASGAWDVQPNIITADFRTHNFNQQYDVIFFLGVIYHLEDVFTCMKMLRELVADQGVIYMETQMSGIHSELPIFEFASDIYPTIAGQGKDKRDMVGISNYLFPNEPAVRNLAHTYDFEYESLDGPDNVYSQELPARRIFKFTKLA
ncbi:MAG: Methyltransferase type 11 [Paucimonas sp.]|nr:Methyltransferase type 11 [Paucimonas sp.]